MTKAFLTLLAANCVIFSARAEKHIIDFSRPTKPGQAFECQVAASNSQTYQISPKTKENATISHAASLRISGSMLVQKTLPNGNPSLVEFKVKDCSGTISDKKYNLDLAGKTLIINMAQKPTSKFTLKNNERRLNKTDVRMLSLIFRPASQDTLKELMGTDKALATGDSWQPPTRSLEKAMLKRNVKITPAHIKAKATLKARTKFQNIDCWEIIETLEIDKVPGLTFKFRAAILLPVDKKLGGAVRIKREGYEKAVKKLPEDNPLAAGKTITIEVSDKLEATVIPLP